MYGKKKKAIDREKFKRFFFYGIENKREVKEGILYFSLNKVYDKHMNENWYQIPNEQMEEEMMQEATQKYKQFYKFVTLNDVPNNRILVNIDNQVRKELEEQMQILRKEKNVIDTKAGIFFIKEKEKQLEGIDDSWRKTGDNWTEQIYEILEKLQQMEKDNNIEYQKYLLLTKQARALNRGDKQEAFQIKRAYEKLEEKQEKGER